MPIYEYCCENCGKEFEMLLLGSDSEMKTCKFCQGPVKRKMSLTTFHLKGTGWYVTDYNGKKAPPCESEKVESQASTEPAADKTAKTESAT